LLGCPVELLETYLTTKKITAGNEQLTVPLSKKKNKHKQKHKDKDKNIKTKHKNKNKNKNKK